MNIQIVRYSHDSDLPFVHLIRLLFPYNYKWTRYETPSTYRRDCKCVASQSVISVYAVTKEPKTKRTPGENRLPSTKEHVVCVIRCQNKTVLYIA